MRRHEVLKNSPTDIVLLLRRSTFVKMHPVNPWTPQGWFTEVLYSTTESLPKPWYTQRQRNSRNETEASNFSSCNSRAVPASRWWYLFCTGSCIIGLRARVIRHVRTASGMATPLIMLYQLYDWPYEMFSDN